MAHLNHYTAGDNSGTSTNTTVTTVANPDLTLGVALSPGQLSLSAAPSPAVTLPSLSLSPSASTHGGRDYKWGPPPPLPLPSLHQTFRNFNVFESSLNLGAQSSRQELSPNNSNLRGSGGSNGSGVGNYNGTTSGFYRRDSDADSVRSIYDRGGDRNHDKSEYHTSPSQNHQNHNRDSSQADLIQIKADPSRRDSFGPKSGPTSQTGNRRASGSERISQGSNERSHSPSETVAGHINGETSASGSGSGSGAGVKKRRRDSDLPKLEEMDDRPLAITCAPCRSRKIKCDSKKPSCENCSKSPAECYYPIKLKPGLRPGAGMDVMRRVEVLEDRMQAYEARLVDQEIRLNQYSQAQFNQVLSSTSNQPFMQTPSTGMAMAPPSIELPPELNPLSFGPSTSPSGLSTTSFRDPNILPPDDVVRDLIVLFFTHIHPWAPILSPVMPNYTAPWNIVVHAIVVVTLRLSSDPRLAGTKQAYRAAAKQHILGHAIESTSISSVQALTLLALDLIGSEQGPSSWGILALLTRSAVHLGLAVEEDHSSAFQAGRAPTPSLSRTSIIPPANNWHEDELRRRLFWMIFCLDRYACVSTGWDFALPDFDIKRRLPAADELWMKTDWYQAAPFKPVLHREWTPDPTTLSPLAYLVEALDLLGRSHTLQSQNIEAGDARAVDVRKDMTMTLTSAAKRWYNELTLRDRRDGMSLMIQAIHHATLLKLNAYYAFPALSNGEPQEPYTSTCLTSARSVVALTHTARELGWQNASSPLFIWSSWVAARVLFVHAFLSHKNQPDDEFDIIVSALKEQAQYWTLANQYAKLLERAKRKWLSASQDANPNLPEAIHVLLDLRRTAYSAVGAGSEATPHVSPPDVNLSHLPAWAVQPLLGDLHDWFDLPAGLFQSDA